ncbi:MAG: helix-turn-helix domain-containing protein [Candidatus Jordarchaeales archaeon]
MPSSPKAVVQSEEMNTATQKVIELLTPVRECIVRTLLSRFPMRGLEQMLREAFDNAVSENLCLFSSLISQKEGEERREESLKKAMLDAKELLKTPAVEGDAPESLKEDVLRLRKEIDRLVLELKVRDKKIKEQEKLLEKLRALNEDSLFVTLLGGNMPQTCPETLSFWKQVSTFLEKEPKFKILRLLIHLKELSLEKLYQSTGIQKQLVARYLDEMKEAGLIEVVGENVRLKI